jgi:hypothetical protein
VPQTADSLLLYFPLKVGNYWQYDWRNHIATPGLHMYYQTQEVLFDTVMSNGFKYYAVYNSKYQKNNYFRIDTLNATVCTWLISNSESVVYDLKESAYSDTIFGCPTRVIQSGHVDNELGIAYGFGKVWEQDYSLGWPYRSTIIYAKINGKEYGSLVSVPFSSLELRDYKLFQNYPNPFNPTTSIRYNLKRDANVTLKIVNILGQEVQTLISERQSAGEHEVFFNGSNLSSGVYLYRLKADNFSETRKMILLN